MNVKDYRIKSIGARAAVDNEKELYTSYIRRLEIELELAHEREKRLLDELIRAKTVDRVSPTSEESMGPINQRMSFREAARRVKEFERNQRAELEELSDAKEIEKSISNDVSRGISDGQGFAI